LRVAIASSSLVSTDAIESLVQWPQVEIVSIISNPDKSSGRGLKLSENSLAQWASSKGLNVDKPGSQLELIDSLKRDKIELLITIAYGHILSLEVLGIPKYGCINLHFSILPKYRGAAPVQWTLLNGDTNTGVTVFNLDQGMDTGPILRQQIIDVDKDDSTNSLLKKLSLLSGPLLKESIIGIGNGEKGTPQSNAGASLAPKISKENGRINWGSSASEIYNQYRALFENPGVYTQLSGERVRINKLVKTDQLLEGEGDCFLQDARLLVATKDFAIELLSVTPEGRKEMSGIDFYNGLKSKTGITFA
jgi:methionyl-tRNA formyltransferase